MSHFSALASSWWDPQGPSRILHLMNPLRHTFIQRCLNTYPDTPSSATTRQNLHYLDVGCGGGIFAESAARLPTTRSVTAIDPTPSVLAVAKQHQRTDPLLLSPGRLTYLNTAVENLPVPLPLPLPLPGHQDAAPAAADDDAVGSVDIVTCFEVVEHVSAPAPFLRNCLKHVKPGGWLILSTMNRTWTSWATTIVAAEEVMRVVPRGTHDWNQYIDLAEMEEWARGLQGWGGMQSMGVVYVPGFGWKEVKGSERWGNYFFGIRRDG